MTTREKRTAHHQRAPSQPVIGPALLLGALCLGPFCACENDEPSSKTAQSAVPASSAGATQAASSRGATAAALSAALQHQRFPVPTGPRLAILAGQGVGPIRIGATVPTIERHMQKPCELRTEDACRYIGRAVEFFLDEDGVTREIRIHGRDRPTTPKGRVFGVFNGRFPEGAAFGMYPHAVIELIGKPKRVEKVESAGKPNIVEIHHYDGMRLEYERIENGNVVLGGVVIFKPKAKGPAASGAPGAASAPPKASAKPE